MFFLAAVVGSVAAFVSAPARGDPPATGAAGASGTPLVTPDSSDAARDWSRVIVELRMDAPLPPFGASGDDGPRREAVAKARERLLASLPAEDFRLTRAYDTLPYVALDVSPAGLAALRTSPLVGAVRPDGVQRATGGPPPPPRR